MTTFICIFKTMRLSSPDSVLSIFSFRTLLRAHRFCSGWCKLRGSPWQTSRLRLHTVQDSSGCWVFCGTHCSRYGTFIIKKHSNINDIYMFVLSRPHSRRDWFLSPRFPPDCRVFLRRKPFICSR